MFSEITKRSSTSLNTSNSKLLNSQGNNKSNKINGNRMMTVLSTLKRENILESHLIFKHLLLVVYYEHDREHA